MSQSSQIRKLIGVALAAVSLMGLVSCTTANADPSKSMFPAPTSPPIPLGDPVSPPLDSSVALVLDVTSSTRPEYLVGAATLVADALDTWVQPGKGGVELAVTLINSRSYDPVNEVLVGKVSGLPQLPSIRTTTPRPIEPDLSSCRKNAFSRVKCEETLVQEYNDALSMALEDELLADKEHDLALAAHAALVRQRANEMKSLTDRIRSLTLPPDNKGSDISGGILRAAEFLNASSAQHKWIIIQSDLDPSGPQQRGDLHLQGFNLVVVFWDCRESRSCATRKDEVTQRFFAAGAASVVFYDPASSRVVSDILGGAK